MPRGSKFSLLRSRGLGVVPRRTSRSVLSAQGDTSLLVLGNPRLCDLAPNHRASASDLDDGEVFLNSEGDVRYYNLTPRRRHSFSEFLRCSASASAARQCHKRCDKCSEKGQYSRLIHSLSVLSVCSRRRPAAPPATTPNHARTPPCPLLLYCLQTLISY